MDNGASSYRRFRDEGDENGLIEIIREYRDGLIFYLNSIVNDIHAAEELAEDTFVLLGTKKPRDKGIGSFKTWLYTIGRNRALNYLRRRGTRDEASLEDCPQTADAGTDPEQLLFQDHRKQTVHKAMEKLKPEYRQVLWLTYFECLSNKDTAAVMKKTTHSAETLVSRARKSLKSQLEMEGFMYEDL